MKKTVIILVILIALLAIIPSVFLIKEYYDTPKMDPFKELMDGNARYVSSTTICQTDLHNRRAELVQKQNPFAVIVCCSDSRVPPEIVFDQHLGDLFVVRVAGNVIDTLALGSIEYAVQVLGSRLVMVLGHANCGAVNAALSGAKAPGHVEDILEKIQPAVEAARHDHGDLLENAIKANVRNSVAAIQGSEPILKPLVAKEKIKVVGGYYHLDSGKVELIP